MKIGIIICDRRRDGAGGKRFRSARAREGAFARYPENEPLEIVGYTTWGGCPGGNIEHTPEEMIKNGVDAIVCRGQGFAGRNGFAPGRGR